MEQKIYIVLRIEEHDDYIEKTFEDEADAVAYCFQFGINDYKRIIEEHKLIKKSLT